MPATPIRSLSEVAASPARKKALLVKRDAWLREIDPDQLFHRLFDIIPGVYFFAKNLEGELMFLNQSNRARCHLEDTADVVGLTDFDVNPPDLARSYVADDARIHATGEPLLNRVELWFNRMGMPDWFVVNKMPIRSHSGKIIGIMGFTQSYEGRAKLLQPLEGISKAVSHLRENYPRDVTIVELARLAGMSSRQLERKFKAAFGVGPQQFLIKTRLLAACRALKETRRGMAEIAYACGFCDQSAFARHFRRHMGMTARAYRERQEAP